MTRASAASTRTVAHNTIRTSTALTIMVRVNVVTFGVAVRVERRDGDIVGRPLPLLWPAPVGANRIAPARDDIIARHRVFLEEHYETR